MQIKRSNERPVGSPTIAPSVTPEGAALDAALLAFKTNVVQRNPGDSYVYHVGHLAADIASSPALANIQMFSRGLQLMGRVELRQKRLKFEEPDSVSGLVFVTHKTEYSLRVRKGQRINLLDFDTARKLHLEDLQG